MKDSNEAPFERTIASEALIFKATILSGKNTGTVSESDNLIDISKGDDLITILLSYFHITSLVTLSGVYTVRKEDPVTDPGYRSNNSYHRKRIPTTKSSNILE